MGVSAYEKLGALGGPSVGGGAWQLVTTIPSPYPGSVSSMEVTGLGVDFQYYAVVGSNFQHSSGSAELRFLMGDSGGMQTGSGDYLWHRAMNDQDVSTYQSSIGFADDSIQISPGTTGTTTEPWGIDFVLYINTMRDSNNLPTAHGHYVYQEGSNGDFSGGQIFGSVSNIANMDRIGVEYAGTTIGEGRLSVYGIAHD